MLPLNPILKDAFEKFEQDFLACNLPEASTAKYYKVGQPCFEDKFRSSIQILIRSVFLPSPLGPLWARFPYKFLRNLNTKLGRISTINFTVTFAKTASSCNTVIEKCRHNIKATLKRVKSQIQTGADPERAVRHGYENACDYFEIMNKIILIQQKALACLSKSVAHILQRELYTMGNTGLLRREAKITFLQPHLGDSRLQELRNSPFWPSLFRSHSVKDGKDFLLKKGTPKDSQGFGQALISIRIRKEAPTGIAPMGAIPPKAVINCFLDLGLSLFVWWEDILNAIKYVLKSLNRGKLKTRKYNEKYLSCQNGTFTE